MESNLKCYGHMISKTTLQMKKKSIWCLLLSLIFFSIKTFSLSKETIPLYVINTTVETIKFVGMDVTIKLVNACPTIGHLANIQLQNLWMNL